MHRASRLIFTRRPVVSEKSLFSHRLCPGSGRKGPSSVSTSEWTQNFARFCSLPSVDVFVPPSHTYLPFLRAIAVFLPFAMQVVVVVMRRRLLASEAGFTLGGHSSMRKLVVPLRDMGSLSASSRSSTTISCTGSLAGMGFSRVPGHRPFSTLVPLVAAEERRRWRACACCPYLMQYVRCCPLFPVQ